MKKTLSIATAVVVASALLAPLAINAANKNSNPMNPSLSASTVSTLVAQGISKPAVEKALEAYQWSIKKGDVKDKKYLTIVDFGTPSNHKRLFVVDMKTKKVIMREYVSQGSGSGRGQMATHFSDKEGSHSSVLGVMVTANTYSGKHGFSLRLKGLEPRNERVMERAIVLHAANYVTDEFIQEYNRAGNSWGCFAVDPKVSKKLINTIKDGSVLFAYSPQISNADYV